MSPEASRRITTAACSVADQVDRAVCAAVQAISPGLRAPCPLPPRPLTPTLSLPLPILPFPAPYLHYPFLHPQCCFCCFMAVCVTAGRLPMSMTSQAYGQEADERSHTALMRSRLVQQMQAPPDCHGMQPREGHPCTESRSVHGQKSARAAAEGCFRQPVRGSGQHHYLPYAGASKSTLLLWKTRVQLHVLTMPPSLQWPDFLPGGSVCCCI